MQTETPAYFFNLRIDEPVNLITDLSITVVCIYAYLSLRKRAREDTTVWCMNRYFFFLGIGTLFGGLLGHGLIYLLSPRWRLVGWISGMLAVTFAELGAINQLTNYLKSSTVRTIRWIIMVEFFLMTLVIMLNVRFIWVEVHSVFGLLFVFAGSHFYLLSIKTNLGSIYSLTAIGILVISILVFGFEFKITSWMSHYYTSHLLIATSVWFNYKGVVHLPEILRV